MLCSHRPPLIITYYKWDITPSAFWYEFILNRSGGCTASNTSSGSLLSVCCLPPWLSNFVSFLLQTQTQVALYAMRWNIQKNKNLIGADQLLCCMSGLCGVCFSWLGVLWSTTAEGWFFWWGGSCLFDVWRLLLPPNMERYPGPSTIFLAHESVTG